ncbi:MAG: hypothetical protein U9R68_03540, partial [Planctomycetota bacterium]|nr:hypothetical protein [Planctomycetota bacterium]
MAKSSENAAASGPHGASPDDRPPQLLLRLHTPDAGLRRAWDAATPPPGFRLEHLRTLTPDALTAEGPSLVLLDAAAATAADPLADAI